MEKYAIKQLSVFLENKKGELSDITNILTEEEISIQSLLLLDSTDFGILRLILKTPERAKEVLTAAGFTVRENQVFAVKVADEIGSFNKVARILSKTGIDILYTYAFRSGNEGVFVFKVGRDDFATAVKALQEGQIEIVEESFFIKIPHSRTKPTRFPFRGTAPSVLRRGTHARECPESCW